MSWRRAWIPVLAATLAFGLLVWFVCTPAVVSSTGGAPEAGLGFRSQLARWLTAWVHDPASGGPARHAERRETGQLVRIGLAVLLLAAGALWTARALPPTTRPRLPASLCAVWAWSLIAGVLATTASAPWLVAGSGSGYYMPARAIAARVGEGLPLIAGFGFIAAAVFVTAALLAGQGLDAAPEPEPDLSPRPARLGATVGTAAFLLAFLFGNHFNARRKLQEIDFGSGNMAEANEFFARWLFLDVWQLPQGGGLSRTWLVMIAADLALAIVLWLSLRQIPALLSRPTIISITLATVCALVLANALLTSLRVAVQGNEAVAALASFGSATPATLTFALLAGLPASLAFRVVRPRPAPALVPEPAT